MSSITYNLDIPDAPNNPSVDQPKMKVNTNATSAIMAVDHYTFAESNAGTHRQVDFPNANAAGTQTGAQLTIYTAPGTASSASSQLFWKNSNGGGSAPAIQLNPIKAWALCNSGGIVASQSNNVNSISRSALGQYTVTLNPNCVVGSNYAILISCNLSTSPSSIAWANYTAPVANVFGLVFQIPPFGTFVDPPSFSFQVLQI